MNGPRLNINASCFDCQFCHAERYTAQGDSGYEVDCLHPEAPKETQQRTIWNTPGWCPEMRVARRTLMEQLQQEME